MGAKGIIICVLVFSFASKLAAQLNSLSNQYVLNGLSINPAYAGTEEAFSTTLLYRSQWTGFTGAPKTLTASAHSPLRNELVGLGLFVMQDQIGVSNETSLMANYAYKIETGAAKLSFGLGFGLTYLDIAWDKLEMGDVQDTELSTERVSAVNPNISIGTYYYSEKYFVGFSIPFMLSHTYADDDSYKPEVKNNFGEYNYHLTSGYTFELNEDYELLPSLLIRYNPGDAFQADFNAQLSLYDRFRLGFTYRTVDELSCMVLLKLTQQLWFAYSYDLAMSKASRYYGASHEFMVKYVFKLNANVVGPGRF